MCKQQTKFTRHILKNANYRKKNTRSETHKKYILPWGKEVHWKFSSHNYLCKHSQIHKQLYQKSTNDDSLWHDKSNKRIEDTTWITKETLTTKPHAGPDSKNLHSHSNETEDPPQ